MSTFNGFEFEPVNYDPKKHKWDDISKQPLKFQSIKFDFDQVKLEVLDQLLLPTQTKYIPVQNVQDAFDVIRQMNVRGAPLIATVALLGLCVDLEHQYKSDKDGELSDYVKKCCDHLHASRPTAINLTNEILKLKEFVCKLNKDDGIDANKRQIYQHVYNLYTAEREENDRLLRNATICVEHNVASEDKDGLLNVIHICNTGALATCSLGTALGVIRCLHQRGRLGTAFCLETRPYNQGSRLTAYELLTEGIPHCLITDSMAASVMRKHKIHAILVGADQVALNGDTANKIGTFSLSILAQYHQIPFYVVTPISSINPRINSGNEIKIEERNGDELRKFNNAYIAPPECTVWNPAFDVTPAKLITAVLTDNGNVKPDDVKTLFQ
ncbi:Methylthioribose-1-phosphate isomerase [Aphelenchoides bicaudatus]|nr:Methylthioribose-1-phosphate isomerase [Aphelenchoides bicaudatus]